MAASRVLSAFWAAVARRSDSKLRAAKADAICCATARFPAKSHVQAATTPDGRTTRFSGHVAWFSKEVYDVSRNRSVELIFTK
jgi:hypothetical protein